MKVIPIYQSSDGCNTYIVSERPGECVIIDAGADPYAAEAKLKENGLKCAAVLMTHGHFDHIQCLSDYVSRFGCGVYMHPSDTGMLTDADKNASAFFGFNTAAAGVDPYPVTDGEALYIAGLKIKVLHTPGHTPGSVCYLIDNCLFSGDTLFCGSIGRWDLPGGDEKTLFDSLKGIAERINNDTAVYPGHGESTLMSAEKAFNPYLRGLLP